MTVGRREGSEEGTAATRSRSTNTIGVNDLQYLLELSVVEEERKAEESVSHVRKE